MSSSPAKPLVALVLCGLASLLIRSSPAAAGSDGRRASGERGNPDSRAEACLAVDENHPVGRFYSSELCGSCHLRAYEEHARSRHASSATGPVFRAAMRELGDAGSLAWSCLACHAPTVFSESTGASLAAGAHDLEELPGVTCEVCHLSLDLLGPGPDDGRLLTCPGESRAAGRGHAALQDFQRSSLLCAGCHQGMNDAGVIFLNTYEEWSRSQAAAAGVTCQDCHASPPGFLIDGRSMTVHGRIAGGPESRSDVTRSGLHSHEYPGSSWPVQLQSAVELEIRPLPRAPDGSRAVEVLVKNVGAAHAIPTGWTALRLLWLEVELDGLPLQAEPVDPDRPWDVAGASPAETPDIPAGTRLYRTVFLDEEGRPTSAAWEARSVAFDNRLAADEVRREVYALGADLGEEPRVRARLLFVPRPRAWSRARDLPVPRTTLVAEQSLRIQSP